MKTQRILWSVVSMIIVAAMLLTACAPAATETPAPVVPEVPAATVAPSTGGMTVPPAGPELKDAYAGKFKGTKVTMAGPFTDNDAVKFDQSVKAFEDATGIDIVYSGSKEFEASIRIAVEGGSAPDIVDFPQPGLLANFVAEGKVVDLNKVIDPAWLKQNYIQSWLDMGTMQGKDGPIMAGVWGRANGKSLVLYPKKPFDTAGYTDDDELSLVGEGVHVGRQVLGPHMVKDQVDPLLAGELLDDFGEVGSLPEVDEEVSPDLPDPVHLLR